MAKKVKRPEISAKYYQQSKEKKLCPACQQEKSLTEFPIAKNRPSGRASHCKQCRKTRYPYNPARHKISHLLNRYGLEWEQYLDLYEKQNNQCAICHCSIGLNGTAHVDHCHVTNKVRGLLCVNCNKGLGSFKDSGIFLRDAATYVESSQTKASNSMLSSS